MLRLLLVTILSLVLAPQATFAADASDEAQKAAILAVIARMEAAWNRGDFGGYIEGFANPDVIFVSHGEFQKDWQGTLDHYIRDYVASEATRGHLHFFDIHIEMLGPDAAQLVSRHSRAGATSPFRAADDLIQQLTPIDRDLDLVRRELLRGLHEVETAAVGRDVVLRSPVSEPDFWQVRLIRQTE